MFELEVRDQFSLVSFSLPSEGIEPSILPSLSPPDVDGSKGVVISGRGPVWLFAALVHHYHPSAWVATFDPRLGAVVVESHSPKGPQPGQIVEMG